MVGGFGTSFNQEKANETIKNGGTVIVLYDTKDVQGKGMSQYWHYIQYRGNYLKKSDGSVSMNIWDYGAVKSKSFKTFESGRWGVWYIQKPN